MNELTLDPSITADELNDALGATPAPFPETETQDDLASLLARVEQPLAPNTPVEAIAVARQYSQENHFVGIGYCLRTVHEYFNVPALWPDALTAWEHSGPRNLTSNPLAIPRGAIPYWDNNRHGHVAISVGGGLCWTTDYRRNGYVDLAPMASLGPWCGGQLVGWGETLNGYDAWPKDNPVPPKPWSLEERRRFIARALRHAKANHASVRRVLALTDWLAHIDARIQERGKKK